MWFPNNETLMTTKPGCTNYDGDGWVRDRRSNPSSQRTQDNPYLHNSNPSGVFNVVDEEGMG